MLPQSRSGPVCGCFPFKRYPRTLDDDVGIESKIHNAAEGFMAQHQALLSRRRPTVFPRDDLDVCPTDPDGHCLHEDQALMHIRLRKILVPGCPGLFRFYRNRFYGITSRSKA
jgi:hypothetical protein